MKCSSNNATNHCSGKVKPVKAVSFEPAKGSTTFAIPHPIFHFGRSSGGEGGTDTKGHTDDKTY